MQDQILDFVQVLKQIPKFKDLDILSIYNNGQEVHISSDTFCSIFQNYKATQRNCNLYEIELHEVVDGVRFIAIFSVGEFHASA